MRDLHTITHPVHISFPNSETIAMHPIGSVALTHALHIHNVFYVPSFNYNLLSISRLVHDTKLNMLFSPTHCILQDQHQMKVLATGKMQGGLYHFTFPPSHLSSSINNISSFT